MINDGTPYDGKLSRTVWSGGKLGDNIKELPITIGGYHYHCQERRTETCVAVLYDRGYAIRKDVRLVYEFVLCASAYPWG